MTRVRKMLVMVCAAALFCFGCLCLSACSQEDPTEKAENEVEDMFNKIKDLDDDTMDELLSNVDVSTYEQYGVDGEEFMRSFLAGFDYTIDDFSLNDDGDVATCEMTITSKSFSQLITLVTQKSVELGLSSDYANMSEDERNAEIGNTYMEALDEVPTVTSDPITMEFDVDGDTVTMTDDSRSALMQAMFNN